MDGIFLKYNSEKAWRRKRGSVLYGIVRFIGFLPLRLMLAQMRIEVNGGAISVATILRKHSERSIGQKYTISF